MYVKEIWHYPVKSMAGERVGQSEVTAKGLALDRQVLVMSANGRMITSRTHPKLLGLKGTIGLDGEARISGHAWKSPEAKLLVENAVGAGAILVFHDGVERFDVLPLLVASDGAIEHMKIDGRRLRPNIIIGGVEGLAERSWPGRQLRIGSVIIGMAQLRGRCVMTTFDPDTLKQDMGVLRRIVNELEGVMALDSSVEATGWIKEGDKVELLSP